MYPLRLTFYKLISKCPHKLNLFFPIIICYAGEAITYLALLFASPKTSVSFMLSPLIFRISLTIDLWCVLNSLCKSNNTIMSTVSEKRFTLLNYDNALLTNQSNRELLTKVITFCSKLRAELRDRRNRFCYLWSSVFLLSLFNRLSRSQFREVIIISAFSLFSCTVRNKQIDVHAIQILRSRHKYPRILFWSLITDLIS